MGARSNRYLHEPATGDWQTQPEPKPAEVLREAALVIGCILLLVLGTDLAGWWFGWR